MQTTISTTEDDWSIFRFSMLQDYLASIKDEAGNSLFEVTGRDYESNGVDGDPVLSSLLKKSHAP